MQVEPVCGEKRLDFGHMRRWATVSAMGLLVALLVAPAMAQQANTTSAAPALTPKEIEALQQYKAQTEVMLKDWPNLKRFYEEDMALPQPGKDEKRVVFMGDSITQGWMNHGTDASPANPGFFPGKPWIDRGISGQTTPQMLLRFRQDVIDLKPSAVVIFAGTNDVAGNTGDMTAEQTEANLASMAELARVHHIRVVLCSILPAYDFPWRPGREPAPKIVAINKWIKDYADSNGDVYVDFYSAMVDSRGGLPANLSHDGVHPNPAGYAIMNPLVEAGIAKALGQS
ncbi:SGNH/GDSL hydrolase family protein [Acidicapsa dinghuensis]|uniref:SGNH/GDSL hydrolase family protein n=1 Tax=Acidicapsa dinghuensis TaxID=2218256 RepID=A0ABW1EI67_9BACT|nr:SGNH/GDSL hydrolase family protein [Acidicapsa dinghuensis]